MNLIFRMLWLLISVRFKTRLPAVRPENELTLRVLPNDLDINLHMNNGRYLTICDLSRVDMFLRTGLAKAMVQNKWMPIITEHTMQYKKALRLFQKYTVHMAITDWDERNFHMTHTFKVGDRIVAEGTSKGVIYSKKDGVIPPEQVMETVSQYRAGTQ
ncbi:MAG: thioesterase family protein [Gammaproteobacteria bacterium]|nr:thioesterase family protein [Gammaproteobacteria bacterium]MDH5650769.1 thioesterase family protein [Gammaproteobacteria bacterium]